MADSQADSHADGEQVVEAYLQHVLTAQERANFEAHLVDCEACRDRVLLAEMFHARNGAVRKELVVQAKSSEPEVEVIFASKPYRSRRNHLPLRARFVASLEPWQIWVLLSLAALLLVLIPTSYFIFEGR